MLTWKVPEKEISSLSMRNAHPSRFPHHPNRNSTSIQHQLWLRLTSLFLNLRAVEPWAVLDRSISVSPLHVCVPCFLLLFSISLPAWQVGSGPFTENVIALNASWDNLGSTETSTLWELKDEIVQKNKTHKDKCRLLLCNFCFFLIFF